MDLVLMVATCTRDNRIPAHISCAVPKCFTAPEENKKTLGWTFVCYQHSTVKDGQHVARFVVVSLFDQMAAFATG